MDGFDLTPTGKRSTARASLVRHCNDPALLKLLAYRNTAGVMLGTFIRPWIDLSQHDGRIHPQWHQTRGDTGFGTRTGRVSSSNPNAANIPNTSGLAIPDGFPTLPSVRSALLPEEGHIWVSADYSQQELRIAAHFEDGGMLSAYQQNPQADFHDNAMRLVKGITGMELSRKTCKITGFSILYGAGAKKLAEQLDIPLQEAALIREAYLQALPGLSNLIQRVKEKARADGFITSVGGRRIFVQPTSVNAITGERREFSYKLPNALIQGSAADQTKQAIIDMGWKVPHARMLATVYDEINVSVPVEHVASSIDALRECMANALPMDVPVKVDIKVGSSWGDIK